MILDMVSYKILDKDGGLLQFIGGGTKAPRATARACKSSLKLGQVAAAEIADGALFLFFFFCKSSVKLGQVAAPRQQMVQPVWIQVEKKADSS